MARSRNAIGVMHEYASGQFDSGQNSSGNVFFNGDTVFSYGRHFPMAQRVQTMQGAEVFLITTDTYSVTTAKHITYATRALNGVSCFRVPNVNIETVAKYKRADNKMARAANKDWRANVRKTNAVNHAANIADYRERFEAKLKECARSRKYKDMLLSEAFRLATEANSYIDAFKLRAAKIATDSIDLESIRARVKEAAKAAKIANEKWLKKVLRENAEKIHAWRQGANVYLPYDLAVILRVSADGLNVETSQRANFPVSAASGAWKAIKRARATNMRWQSNGSKIRLGIHQLDYVESNGDLKAGCHYVKYAESLGIARALNFEV
jgi:hypothetical protein